MGKSSGQTIGYWYRVAYHHILGIGPIDALLEIRGGDKTAWSGEITASTTFHIEARNLWGGEKDQGGISGDCDIMFGDAAQQLSVYLQALGEFCATGNQSLLPYLATMAGSAPPASTPNAQVPAWRGVTSFVFKGGYFGAMNPYPQKPAYKIRRTLKGWDNDTCWYPEKAEVPVTGSGTLPADADGWQYQILPDETNPGYENLTVPTDGWLDGGQAPFAGGLLSGNTDWPIHTILWIRRTVTVGGINQVLTVIAENGCVVFINGAIAGAVNRDNIDIDNNQNNTFKFPVAAGKTYEIAVKGFDEKNSGSSSGTEISISIEAPGLIAMNPAHILYDARTAEELGGEPIATIHDASFRTGADWFYNHGIGLCTEYDSAAETIEEFIARVSQVAGCSVNRSPVDGLWYLDIANGVYDLASLPILTDDDILEFAETPRLLDSTTNSVSIEYFDPQLKTTVTTPPTQALALVTANGLNHAVKQYHEIPTATLAGVTAVRELAAAITPTRAFDLTTTSKVYSWRRFTYFRLQSRKRGIADMVCMLAETGTGTLKSGARKITASQDISSLPTTSFVGIEPGVDTRPPQIPLAIMTQAAFEAPYFELVRNLSRADLLALPDDAGYLMTVAQDPAVSSNYAITVSTDDGATYAATGSGPWCPSALIMEGDPLLDGLKTAFTLAGGKLLDWVTAGSAALWEGADAQHHEFCRVDAIDVVAGTLTLGRGCADTPPVPHAANSRIWFFDGFAGADTTEYVDGETIETKLLTNTGSGQIDPALASPLSLTFAQRGFRPYAPAKLTVAGLSYPGVLHASSADPVALTWVERNRVQQADQLLDTSAATVAAESNTSYTLRTYLDDVLVETQAGLAVPTANASPGDFGMVRVEIDAVRDGLASLYPLSATFDYRGVLTITTTSPITVPSATAGTYQMEASGGVPPLGWTESGLPDGVTLDGDGLLTLDGTTPDGDTNVDFTVTDAESTAVSKTITLRIGTGDPLWANVVSLLHFDGTGGSTAFTDEKGVVWTAGGSAKIDATVAKFGQSADLRTDPSYLDTPLHAAFYPGNQDFCVEAWVRLTSTTAGSFFTIASATEISGPSYGWRFALSGAVLHVYCYNGAGNTWTDSNAPPLAADGLFHHVAFSRKGTTGRFFVDGVMGTDPVMSANNLNIIAPATGIIRVGAWGNLSGRGVRGWVDDFRLTIGAARYTGNFTPPAAPFPGT